MPNSTSSRQVESHLGARSPMVSAILASALVFGPAAARAATCSWQAEDFGIPQLPQSAANLVAEGIADNGEIIINLTLLQPKIGPDVTWLTEQGRLIDLHALVPPKFPRSTALFISRSGKAVVGNVHNDEDNEYTPAKGYWVYKGGTLTMLTLDKSMQVGGRLPDELRMVGVTDQGDVYGTAVYVGDFRAFGSTGGVIHDLGRGDNVAEIVILSNRVGTALTRRSEQPGDLYYRVWQADPKGRWRPLPVSVPQNPSYSMHSLSDNGRMLTEHFGGAGYDPATAYRVVDLRTGREDTASVPAGISNVLTRLAPRGNHFGATFTYDDRPLREVAARFDRAPDGSWTRQDYLIPGALSNNVASVNSRGDMLGYFRASDRLADGGSPYVIRDGVVTQFTALSPTLTAGVGLLGESGQVALSVEDSVTQRVRPVVMTCVPDIAP